MTAGGRWLHPLGWWVWALGLAAAASRTTNPFLLLGLVLAAGVVVSARRPEAAWSRSFGFLLALGAMVVVTRVLFQVVLGTGMGGPVLLDLPVIPLPPFMAGVELLGPVTAQDVLIGLYDGLRLAAILACIGAASSLAAPSRMLKTVPAALYEVGVAVVVTLTFAPQLVSDMWRVRSAQRLRGRRDRGLRSWGHTALPVLNGGLERSISLAAAMDAKGYGRRAEVPATLRAATQTLLLAGLLGVVVGLYALLSTTSASWPAAAMLVAGTASAAGGLALAGRRSVRTRYRPDPWVLPEWLISGCGVLVASGAFVLVAVQVTAMQPSISPFEWPALTPAMAVLLLLASAPAVLAPQLPAAVRR